LSRSCAEKRRGVASSAWFNPDAMLPDSTREFYIIPHGACYFSLHANSFRLLHKQREKSLASYSTNLGFRV
jgi:hypothetical protein